MNCYKDDSASCCGGYCNYNPVVVMATDKRIEITTANIAALKKQTMSTKIVLVVSDRAEMDYYAKMDDVTVLLEPNRPLGRKWQIGVNVAYRKLNANPLIILGSDDLLHPDYIKMAVGKLIEGFDFVGMTTWYCYDVKNTVAYQSEYIAINADFPIGSGKVFSKKVLDSCSGKLFDMAADRKLDDIGHARVRGFKSFLIRQPMVLAVKGRWQQMNTIEAYLKAINIRTRRLQSPTQVLSTFNYV